VGLYQQNVRGLAVYRGVRNDADLQIVLVHGAIDRAAGMIRIARRLKQHEVVRYDRRGYGRSAHAPPTESFSQQIDDLNAVMADRPTVVFGHSYGGAIALALATQRKPAMRAVVTFEAPRAWEEWWPAPPPDDVDPADAAEHFVRRVIGNDRWEGRAEVVRQRRRSEGMLMVEELRAQVTRRYDARQIDIPLIVGVGRRSGGRAQRAASATASEGKKSRLVTITGAGHAAPMTHPEAVAALIRLAIADAGITN
jgi:pimeloyl-ACP methyl ester carboxylesterase